METKADIEANRSQQETTRLRWCSETVAMAAAEVRLEEQVVELTSETVRHLPVETSAESWSTAAVAQTAEHIP